MLLKFILTVPHNGAWNGKFTGEGNLYAIVKDVRPKEKALSILDGHESKGFYYNFGDGWGVNIQVSPTDSKEARKLRKHSKGFMGYNWMAVSIIEKGCIEFEENYKHI